MDVGSGCYAFPVLLLLNAEANVGLNSHTVEPVDCWRRPAIKPGYDATRGGRCHAGRDNCMNLFPNPKILTFKIGQQVHAISDVLEA